MAGQHAHLFRLHLEDVVGELGAQAEGALAAGVEGEAAARRIVAGDCRARLHRAHHDAVVDHRQPHDVLRRLECSRYRRRVAVAVVERHVAGRDVVQLGRALASGGAGGDDGVERLDVGFDRLGPIARCGSALGDHEGDRLAHEAHALAWQRIARRLAHRRAVGVG